MSDENPVTRGELESALDRGNKPLIEKMDLLVQEMRHWAKKNGAISATASGGDTGTKICLTLIGAIIVLFTWAMSGQREDQAKEREDRKDVRLELTLMIQQQAISTKDRLSRLESYQDELIKAKFRALAEP